MPVFSWTLSKYLGTRFLIGVGGILGILAALVFFVDLVELLRAFSAKGEFSFATVMGMALLKVPFLTEQILPFIYLFGSMFCFNQLTRHYELVVVRAAGVSVWQFLAPSLILALVSGVVFISIINPISSALYSRFEQLQAHHLSGKESFLKVSKDGLWLRQGNSEALSVIHALGVRERGAILDDVIIFTFEGKDDNWTGRIDAEQAILQGGYWEVHNAKHTTPGNPATFQEKLKLTTGLTQSQIQDSFASPDTLSFWDLPDFIRTAEEAGFSATKHRLHWHRVLSTPFMLSAMVLIAAAFSLRLTRLGGVGRLVLIGVLIGFFLYFISDVSLALGTSGNLPVIMAAWSPTIIALLLGLATLFHLEDG